MDKLEKVVGKVKDAHGLKGEIYVLVFSRDQSWAQSFEKFSLINEADKKTQTLTVERIKPYKEGFIIKPKEFTNRNQSEFVKGWVFAVDESTFISEEGEDIFLSELLNFTVIENKNNLGQVIGFLSNSAQDLLLVEKDTEQFEIPFVEDFIIEVNYEKKTIEVELPEGLLEINRKSNEREEEPDDADQD